MYANRSVAELCSARDGLRLSAERVTLLRKEDDERLQRLIARTASAQALPAVSRAGVLCAVRPSGKRPYVLVVAAAAKRHRGLSTFRPAVWIVINDPDGETPVPSERLRAAFGLTEAEARLAALLGAGDELRASAEKLGITYGTARARLTNGGKPVCHHTSTNCARQNVKFSSAPKRDLSFDSGVASGVAVRSSAEHDRGVTAMFLRNGLFASTASLALVACGGGGSDPVDPNQPLAGRELARASQLDRHDHGSACTADTGKSS